jgi:hypothetical protein
MYLTHLTFISDGNPDYRKFNKGKKLINFKKRVLFVQEIDNIQLKQQKPYDFEEFDYLQKNLSEDIFRINLDDEKAWDLSKTYE